MKLLCSVLLSGVLSSQLRARFVEWKQTHDITYESSELEANRFQTWLENLEYVEEHNMLFAEGKTTFNLEMNHFADLTSEEFKEQMGIAPRAENIPPICTPAPASTTTPPAEMDWRPKGYVTEVKNQGRCGSCWAFSTVGSLEGAWFKAKNELVSLSEQNLVDCAGGEYGNHGCHGGLMDFGFTYIEKNGGIDTEASYPYTSGNGKEGVCQFDKKNVGATLTSCYNIARGSEADLEAAVGSIGPISVAIDAGHKSFQLYKSGVYVNPLCSSTKLDHGVLAVGYGTQAGSAFWTVKNSWSAAWGMDGYIMMAKDHRNMCGIATAASYPVV